MRFSEAEKRVKKVISENMSVDIHKMEINHRIKEDFGADSLDVAELVMALEEEFETEITDSEAEQLKTLKHIIEFIAERVD